MALAAVGLAVLSLTAASSEAIAPGTASVTIIQAVPGATVSVSIDGRQVAEGAEVGDLLGPWDLAAGDHDVAFAGTRADGNKISVTSILSIEPGGATDVVLHLPADIDGEPVVHSYSAPDGPIGPGKARVMLAHTATVAPADVLVDGQTVFTNIANGEYADADVPEGTVEVALVPSGSKADPILGPLDLSLRSRTLSMIYAYGRPDDGSMKVIAHTTALSADGSVAPSLIDTGSAGAVTSPVRAFVGGTDERSAHARAGLGALMVVAVVAAAGVVRRRMPGARRR